MTDRYELRTLIFNAEMALCDLRGFAAGAESYVDPKHALARASELREEAVKMEAFMRAAQRGGGNVL